MVKTLKSGEKAVVNKLQNFKIFLTPQDYFCFMETPSPEVINIDDSKEVAEVVRVDEEVKVEPNVINLEKLPDLPIKAQTVICIPSDNENSKTTYSNDASVATVGVSGLGRRWTKNMQRNGMVGISNVRPSNKANNLKQRKRMKSLISKFTIPEGSEHIIEPSNPILSTKSEC